MAIRSLNVLTAIFVDFDNVRLGVPDPHPKTDTAIDLIRQLAIRLERNGNQILIRRAYADWEGDGLEGVMGQLSLMSFLPVFVLGHAGKNSADLEMSLDAQHCLLSRDDIQRFVFVTGDRDFIPIVRRVIEAGKEVRIASFRSAASADLLEIAGRANYLDLMRLVVENQRRLQSKGDANGVTKTIEEALAEPDEDYEPTDDELDRAARLIVEADRKYRERGIWLVPFFKDWMNNEFAGMNNDGRKAIVSKLVDEGLIAIETKEDGLGRSNSYSVIVPDHEHVRYLRMKSLIDGTPRAVEG